MAKEAILAEMNSVRTKLTQDIAEVDAREVGERDGCQRALETMLLRHDPPNAVTWFRIQRGEAGYHGTYSGKTSYALEWTMNLVVPPDHPLGIGVRIERFYPQFELRTPEVGWLRKEARMKPLRVEKYFVSEIAAINDRVTHLRLSTEPNGAGNHYDIEFVPEPPHVKIGRGAHGVEVTPYDIAEEDVPHLLELRTRVQELIAGVGRTRTQLVEAKMEGEPFHQGEGPRQTVERLIAAMAPVVSEIARRSLSPTELVLKRLLADERREEIFVTKATLMERLAPLSPRLRRLFDSLGLEPPVGNASISDPPTPMFMKAAQPAAERTGPPPAPTPSSRVPPAVPSAPPTARGLPSSGITLPKSKPQLSMDADEPEVLTDEDTVDVESLKLPVSNPHGGAS
jgi:hypothetical protein